MIPLIEAYRSVTEEYRPYLQPIGTALQVGSSIGLSIATNKKFLSSSRIKMAAAVASAGVAFQALCDGTLSGKRSELVLKELCINSADALLSISFGFGRFGLLAGGAIATVSELVRQGWVYKNEGSSVLLSALMAGSLSYGFGVAFQAVGKKLARPFFIPRSRSAILINGKDLDVTRMQKIAYEKHWETINGYEEYTPYSKGNHCLYNMEAVLSGKISIDLDPEDSRFKQLMSFFDYIFPQALRKRKAILIKDIHKITPDQDMEKAFRGASTQIAAKADDRHLTVVHAFSHGEKDGFEMGLDQSISHVQFIDVLDTIPGKKVVILQGCHSGNLINFMQGHPKRSDYAVITSTGNEVGWNNLEVQFNEILVEQLLQRRRLSDLNLPMLKESSETWQKPDVFLGFDAIF